MRVARSAGALLLTTARVWAQEVGIMLERRSNDTIPSAISIPPSQYWDGNDGPWSSFPIQLGGTASNRQDVRVLASTAAYNTWTIGTNGCPSGYLVADCANKRGFIFNVNNSITWIRDSIYPVGIEDNLGPDPAAYAGYDTVTLGWQGSGGPSVDHSVVYNLYTDQYFLGVFGLNPMPTNFTDLNSPYPSFMQTLYDTGKIPSRAYAYTAGNQYRFNKVFGSLVLGGYDQNRFSGGISWPFYQDVARDLLVNIKTITMGTTTRLLPDGQISAFVDSTIPEIWLPESACQAFEKAFGITYDTASSRYLLNGTTHAALVSANPSVAFTLTNGNQDVTITLPYSAFDLNVSYPIVQNSTFYFPLQRAANSTQYTLGRTFFQEAYLIADYDRGNFTLAPCLWDSNKINSVSLQSILSPDLTAKVAAQQQSLAAASSHSLSVGAIVGIAVGAVVLLVIIGVIVVVAVRKHKSKRRPVRLDEKNGLSDYADAKYGHDSFKNELGSAEIGEMPALSKHGAQELESSYTVDPGKVGYAEMDGRGYYSPHTWGQEMDGTTPMFEMYGSDVHEMPQRHSILPDKIR